MRRHAGGQAHRGCQQIVDQQRRGGDQPRQGAQVLASDHVRAPAGGIAGDGLEVGQGHQDQQAGDGQADGPGQEQPGAPGDQQAQVDLLVGVGDGRQGVGRKGGQRPDLVQPLVGQLLGGQRRPDQQVPESGQHGNTSTIACRFQMWRGGWRVQHWNEGKAHQAWQPDGDETVDENDYHRDRIGHAEAGVEGCHGALDDAHATGQQWRLAQEQRQSIAR